MSCRVLVVDDDRAIARLTGILLRQAGYEVDLAYDGVEALDAARAATPDAILLDVRMPRLDGFEVHRELKRDNRLSAVPVLFVSANAQEAVRHRAMEGGATRFLSKPFDPHELIDAVRGALAGGEPRPG